MIILSAIYVGFSRLIEKSLEVKVLSGVFHAGYLGDFSASSAGSSLEKIN